MSGFVRSESWNFEPCVYCAIPCAVAGVSCISPTAPALERALGVELALGLDHGGEQRRIELPLLRRSRGRSSSYRSGYQSRAYQAGSVFWR